MICYRDLGCFRDEGPFDYLDTLPGIIIYNKIILFLKLFFNNTFQHHLKQLVQTFFFTQEQTY